jgi:hypothetical protein
MNDPVQLAPLLAIYEDEGEYTLRVSDSSLAKQLSSTITRSIGENGGARKLVLITPTDTKVFKFGPKNPSAKIQSEPYESKVGQMSQRDMIRPEPPPQIADASAPPSPELAAYEAEIAESDRLQREIDRENRKSVDLPVSEEPAEDASAPKTRKRTPRPQSNTIPTACGRCQGHGAIEGGGGCPVCRGSGSVSHYGRNSR